MTAHTKSSLTVTEKLCSSCGRMKPVGEFHAQLRRWTNKDGSKTERRYPAPQCKSCDVIRHAAWYQSSEGKAWSKKREKDKWARMSPAQRRARMKATRKWQREFGREYTFYRRHLKPLMK